jgi:hypothetical protein
MPSRSVPIEALVLAIVDDDGAAIVRLLDDAPDLVAAAIPRGATRQTSEEWSFPAIGHHLYQGDTALHVAAAADRVELVGTLLARGADVGARNRRGAQPLHYAVDGMPGAPRWDPGAQRATVEALLRGGADPNAADANGTSALHRAVRNRCAAAVAALLAGGADPQRDNGRGSTALDLARRTTGRGGSGSDGAKAQQAEILELLLAAGSSS